MQILATVPPKPLACVAASSHPPAAYSFSFLSPHWSVLYSNMGGFDCGSSSNPRGANRHNGTSKRIVFIGQA
jgi:hypothetical protein